MMLSQRTLHGWITPLLRLPAQEEQEAMRVILRLNEAIKQAPRLGRTLADRSISLETRLGWLQKALSLTTTHPLHAFFQAALQEEGFAHWSKVFAEYVRLRERLGLGGVFLLKSAAPLDADEQHKIQARLEAHFLQPALLEAVIDTKLTAGVRLESLDGWVYDDTIHGRLQRLATTLSS